MIEQVCHDISMNFRRRQPEVVKPVKISLKFRLIVGGISGLLTLYGAVMVGHGVFFDVDPVSRKLSTPYVWFLAGIPVLLIALMPTSWFSKMDRWLDGQARRRK